MTHDYSFNTKNPKINKELFEDSKLHHIMQYFVTIYNPSFGDFYLRNKN